MIQEKQKIIDFLLDSGSDVKVYDIAEHCKLESIIVEKYLTILVLSGVVRMERHIGQTDMFSLR